MKKLQINGFYLRIIAMTTMVIDHLGSAFFNNPMWMRGVGRIAFIVYAFLLAEGYTHVKDDPDRVRKHVSMLLILAVASEFCYDLMESGLDYKIYMSDQSVIVTLLLGYLALIAIDQLKENKLAVVFACGLSGVFNYFLKGNFNIVGPWLVIAFYFYLQKYDEWNLAQRFTGLACIFVVYLPVYFWGRADFCGYADFVEAIMTHIHWIIFHFVAAFILAFYDGALGYHSKTFSTIYTWFYPAQALIIGLTSVLITHI